MNIRLYKLTVISLPILCAVGAFEILNIGDYYKEQIDVPQMLIGESKEPIEVKKRMLNALIREGDLVINMKHFVEVLTIGLFVAWILIVYYNERKKSKVVKI